MKREVKEKEIFLLSNGPLLRCSLGGENLPKLACPVCIFDFATFKICCRLTKKCFYASGLHSRITVTGFNCSHQSEANSPLSRPIRDQNVLTSRVSTWVTDANRGNHFPGFSIQWIVTHAFRLVHWVINGCSH